MNMEKQFNGMNETEMKRKKKDVLHRQRSHTHTRTHANSGKMGFSRFYPVFTHC